MKTLLFLTFAGSLLAADVPKPPTIPAELQAEIAFLTLDAQQAQTFADKQTAISNASAAKATAICGEKYNLQRVGTKLECVVKPEPAKPAEAPAKK